MTFPAIGEPDPGTTQSRTGFWNAAGGIIVLLALGLTFRLIIAYLLPDSGFKNDLASFRFWANELADHGPFGFYARAADPQTGSCRYFGDSLAMTVKSLDTGGGDGQTHAHL